MPDDETDPVLKNSRREAIIIGLAWLAATVYCCGYCYLFGYIRAGRPLGVEDVRPILGMPSWVFWGIMVPWARLRGVHVLVRRVLMADDDLGHGPLAPSSRRTSAKGACMNNVGRDPRPAADPDRPGALHPGLARPGRGGQPGRSRKAEFLEKYFLGNRSLGAFAVALTAAVMSGGTFMGFPSLVYSFGWVVGLWIASYMVAPADGPGRARQADRPALAQDRGDHPARPVPRAVRQPGARAADEPAGHVLPDRATWSPSSRPGRVIMKIVLPSATVDLVRRPRTRRARRRRGLSARPGHLHGDGRRLHDLRRVPRRDLDRRLPEHHHGHRRDDPLPAGDEAVGRAGARRPTRAWPRPTPGSPSARGPGGDFHPIGLAFSFFVMWAITGMGQPSTMVRLMAFRDSRTLRYSILYLTIYNALIYIPLIFIFVAARSILPDLATSDEVMPRLVIKLANPYVAGLILAAPYGAVMSTVSGWLLIVSSGLVRDLYQRFLRPTASEREIALGELRGHRRASGLVAAVIATAARRNTCN